MDTPAIILGWKRVHRPQLHFSHSPTVPERTRSRLAAPQNSRRPLRQQMFPYNAFFAMNSLDLVAVVLSTGNTTSSNTSAPHTLATGTQTHVLYATSLQSFVTLSTSPSMNSSRLRHLEDTHTLAISSPRQRQVHSLMITTTLSCHNKAPLRQN